MISYEECHVKTFFYTTFKDGKDIKIQGVTHSKQAL